MGDARGGGQGDDVMAKSRGVRSQSREAIIESRDIRWRIGASIQAAVEIRREARRLTDEAHRQREARARGAKA
jgi:hypothetical protein